MKAEEFYNQSYAVGQPLKPLRKFNYALGILRKFKINNFLDIGCDFGQFSENVKKIIKPKKICAVDISDRAIQEARRRRITAQKLDIDRENLPFPDNSFDGIFCGELIEHLYDPDHLLCEIKRVMTDKGICVLTTPNLASWYNRVCLLFGFQPFFTEVSLKKAIGQALPLGGGAGHIRVFCYKSLIEILKMHKFKILFVKGFGINTSLGLGQKYKVVANFFNFIFAPFPSLASDIFIVFKK